MRALEVQPKAEASILVVDDEPAVRRVLEKLLTAEGYDVLLAEDGEQALSLLQVQHVDTILLDVMMPGIDGVEVCRKIRATPGLAHVPVVIVTAADDRACRRRAREAGADDFLSKPFDEVELRARIKNSIRVKRYQDGLDHQRRSLMVTVDEHTRDLERATANLERVRRELDAARQETIERLTRAAEFRDDETAAHLQRMSHYCRMLARKKGLDEYQAELMRVASPMHDVGKIGIPDSILLKPSKLTPAEFEIMKKHAEIGYRILYGSDSELLNLAGNIARSHHEKWDGSGYPYGLRGSAIPLEGRIAAVADVFDALTSKRPYKPAWTMDEATAYLASGRARHFDPELVDLFLGSMDEVLDIRQQFQD
jgi:putative two-component system response regulator